MNRVSSEIKTFSHSKGQNWYHVVLVTKVRYPVFQYAYTKEIVEKAIDEVSGRDKIDVFTKEVMPDHVHIFVSCPPDYSIRKLFRIIKGGTSYLI